MMRSKRPSLQVISSALDAVTDDAGAPSGLSDGDEKPALPQQMGNRLSLVGGHSQSSVRAGVQPPLKPCLAASSGVLRSTENDAKASGFGLPQEGRSPLPFVRLGLIAATIVAALTVSGCAGDRLLRAEGAYAEGRAASLPGREAEAVAAVECRPLRRSVVTVTRGGEMRRELTEIPGGC